MDYENRQANIMAVLSDPYNLQWGFGGGGGGGNFPQGKYKKKKDIFL